ncbi:MAG TPA: protein kinase, partial [Kofleriaceae bacterium]
FLVPDRESPHGVRVKVLDFGLAKVTTTGEPGVTKTGNIVGTPRYMSPEQCRESAVVDPRADIYTLGCILYEMVCGRVPFLDATVGDLIIAHSTMPPPVPSLLSSAICPALDRAILRALAKQPEERFATMSDFGSALAQLAGTAPSNALADTAVARPPRPSVPPPIAAKRVLPNTSVILTIVIALVAVVALVARC